jgi:hypothetical protein
LHTQPPAPGAPQEAQQDSILSFERQLDEAMARDWAADKGRLLGAIAPHTGLGGAGAGGQLSFGTVAPRQGEALAGRVSAREQAYVAVVKRLNAAAAQGGSVDAVAEFGAACAANEDRPGGAQAGGRVRLGRLFFGFGKPASVFLPLLPLCQTRSHSTNHAPPTHPPSQTTASGSTTAMSSVWALLADILAPARAKGLSPSDAGAEFMNALVQVGWAGLVWSGFGRLGDPGSGGSTKPSTPCQPPYLTIAFTQGGRAHLSKLFARHVRNTISKHRAVAQRGGDPDQLRDIQVGRLGRLAGGAVASCLTATPSKPPNPLANPNL